MSVSRQNLNLTHPAERLLRWAFAVSLAAHVLLFGVYQAGMRQHWWGKDFLPAWFKPSFKTLAELKKEQHKPRNQPQDTPLLFVEVDPTIATEAPKNAKYYSSHNSRAANPDISVDTGTPKIDGKQIHEVKTQSAPRAKTAPLQPAPPKNQQAETASEESKPKPKGGPAIGDLAFAKPAPQPGESPNEGDTGHDEKPAHVRPRTLNAAQAQQVMAGEKMKQDGGVSRRLDVDSSLDAIATPFGEYDREVVEAIKNHWWDLLESRQFARDRVGRVVVEFNLNFDGRVTNLRVVENDVGDLLSYVCKSAILDPAPFRPWPSDMRRYFNADSRDVRFTFYYE